MPNPASEDLRIRVVRAYRNGEGSYDEIAARFSIGRASVGRWLSRHRETGSVKPRPHGGGNPARIDAKGIELLKQFVREKPDITLAELSVKYYDSSEAKVAKSIICRALQKAGLGRKKR